MYTWELLLPLAPASPEFIEDLSGIELIVGDVGAGICVETLVSKVKVRPGQDGRCLSVLHRAEERLH